MRPTSTIIEEKPARFSLSYDRIYLIGSVSCKWRYQPKLIHSLLGDSYGCVNHACGAIDPPSRVEYKPVSPPLVLKKLRIREEIYLSDLPTLRSEDEE